MANNASKTVGIVLIVIAVVLDLGILSMWLMPSTMGGMMGGMMRGGMMAGCAMCMFAPLLLSTLLAVLGVVLLRMAGK